MFEHVCVLNVIIIILILKQLFWQTNWVFISLFFQLEVYHVLVGKQGGGWRERGTLQTAVLNINFKFHNFKTALLTGCSFPFFQTEVHHVVRGKQGVGWRERGTPCWEVRLISGLLLHTAVLNVNFKCHPVISIFISKQRWRERGSHREVRLIFATPQTQFS